MDKKQKRTTSKAVLTRKVNELRRLVAEDDKEVVEAKYTAIRAVFREFEEAHDLYHDTLTDDQEVTDSQTLFDTQEAWYTVEMEKVRKYLADSRKVAAKTKPDAKVSASIPAMKLPNAPHPDVFNGTPDIFPMWKAAFHTLVGKYDIGADEKMYYLKQYTTGEAREAIEALFMCPGQSAYEEAMRILEERFGKASLVASGFRRRLEAWPKVSERDSKGLQRFSDFLNQLLVAKKSYPALDCLDDEFENQKMLKKLPNLLVKRWIEQVVLATDFPSFEKFCSFLSDRAKVENHSLWENNGLQTSKAVGKIPTGFTSHALDSCQGGSEGAEGGASSLASTGESPCPVCGGAHGIVRCRTFADMSLPERKTVIHKKGLCFGCLGVGHRSRDCRVRHTCQVCGKKHPTLLHDYGSQQDPTVHVAASATPEKRATTSTMPVVVRNPENGKEMKVFALLDTQSNTHFATKEVLEAIGAQSRRAKLRLKTMHGTKEIDTDAAEGLEVRGLFEKEFIPLGSSCYGRSAIPCHRPSIPTNELNRFPHLAEVDLLPDSPDLPVGLLIGYPCAQAFKPSKFIAGRPNEPFAWKTALGWCVMGAPEGCDHLSDDGDELGATHSVHGCISLNTSISEILDYGVDFAQDGNSERTFSAEDRSFLTTMKEKMVQREDQHYEVPLPTRNKISLPCNIPMAMKRLHNLKARLKRNPELHETYAKHMQELFDNGWAEMTEGLTGVEGRTWYIPHQGVVQHDKFRVVFDCSAEYQGSSLNDHLLTGPNQMNLMLGVLIRFRLEKVALTCDIRKMFYQFIVPPEDRDLLRFLWWKEGDINTEPVACRMKVHLFGAGSSPGVATYGLRRIAEDHGGEFPELARKFIRDDFYVDDGVTSLPSAEEAAELFSETRDLLAKGALTLHKVMSNSTSVMEKIPQEHHAKLDEYPMVKTLGQAWNIRTDCLEYSVRLESRCTSKREILSCLAKFFDPTGMIAPLILQGRMIFHDLCREGVGWDEKFAGGHLKKYWRWHNMLDAIGDVKIPRPLFGLHSCIHWQLHHFADACETGYAACSYVRGQDVSSGEWMVVLVLGKCRVVPIKPVLTVPRLELMAAVLSVQLSSKLRESLPMKIPEFFWTDSTAVLGYVQNEAHRFKTFVANRVQRIHDGSEPGQWFHVASEDNPADDGSRGVWSDRWVQGPEFLRQQELDLRTLPGEIDAVECKTLDTIAIEGDPGELKILSSWFATIKMYAWVLRFVEGCRGLKRAGPLSLTELDMAKLSLVRLAQREFSKELESLKKRECLRKESPLYRLDPFLDRNGLIRVGGRVKRTSLHENLKFPYVLPTDHPITTLIIRHFHDLTHHQGRGLTCGEIRANGFWVVRLTKMVKSLIRKCVTCNRLRGRPVEQKMSDLPSDRAEPAPPFLHSGCDVFGPFVVTLGRKALKRYAVIFTCLVSRAVHLEVVYSLSTDSFLSAFRRLIALRGPVLLLRCDQGTNFMGAKESLLRMGCEFVPNPPKASHRGGAWERMIGVARRVIEGILYEHSSRLDDEGLATLLAETSQVINSRPLTVDSLDDPNSLEPLTPNHLLTMKSKVIQRTGPVDVGDMHLYASKQWKRVQFLVDLFWSRWKKEVLMQNAPRKRWTTARDNLLVGDIVLLVDDQCHRSDWKVGRVTVAQPDQDGLVRTATVRLADRSVLVRPVQKLIHLMSPPS